MKRIITLIIVASFIFTLAACGNGGAQTNPSQTGTGGGASVSAEPAMSREINIGYDGGLCQGVIAIAQEKGFFAAEGLTNTKLVKSENARDAMAGGKLDTSAGMIAVWLKPISNGIDITFTVGLHTGCTSAVVLADSDIEAFSDVVGKTIAITSGIGGQNQNIAFRFLAHDGLRDSDFKWADFPADQGLVVLERGDAAVFVGPDQIIERWVQEGSVRRIRSLTFDEDFINEACCVMGISGDFIRENPVTSEKISRAVYSAALWLKESEENRSEGVQILLDGGWISGAEDYALSLMNLYEWAIDNARTEKSLYDAVDEYKQLGILDANIDAD